MRVPLRRLLAIAAAAAGMGLAAGPASAVRWNETAYTLGGEHFSEAFSGNLLWADQPTDSLSGLPGTQTAGDRAGLRWCNNQGSGTYIRNANFQAWRWHAVSNIRIEAGPTNDGSGGYSAAESEALPSQGGGGYTLPFSNGATDFASQCITARVSNSGAPYVGYVRQWTFHLGSVVMVDQQAPDVETLAIEGSSTAGWFTGPVTVHWTGSDNSALRGNTGSRIVGVTGWSDHGDQDDSSDGYDLGSGSYTAEVVKNGSGGQSGDSAQASFNVDRDAPAAPTSVSLTGVSNGAWTNSGSVSMSAAGGWDGHSGVNRYELNVNSGGFPGPGSVSAEGWYAVGARTVDNVGLTASSGTLATFGIDRTAPAATATDSALVAGNHNLRRLTFNLADQGAAGIQSGVAGQTATVQVNDGGWRDIATKTAATGANTLDVNLASITSDGAYPWRVRVRDAAGNYSGWADAPADKPIIVDRTAPDAVFTPTPGIWPSFTVSWSGDDHPNGVGIGGAASAVIKAYDGGSWVTLATLSPTSDQNGRVSGVTVVDVSGLSAGRHDGRLTVTDRLGHATDYDVHDALVSDTDPPSFLNFNPDPVTSDPTKVRVRFQADDGSDGVGVSGSVSLPAVFECSADGSTWHSMGNLNAGSTPLADGANDVIVDTSACPQGEGLQLRFSGADRAGNIRSNVAVDPALFAAPEWPHGFTVDRTAPGLTSPSAAALRVASGASTMARFGFDLQDPNPTLGLDGTKVATVQVQDLLDSGWETVGTINTAPGAQPESLVSYGDDFSLAGITDQQRSRYRITAPDRAGNQATYTSPAGALVIDRTAPAVSDTSVDIPGVPASSGLATDQVRAGLTVDDNQPTGVGTDPAADKTLLQAFQGGSWRTVGQAAGGDRAGIVVSGSTAGLAEGDHDFRLVVEDLLGNQRITPVGQHMVDRTAPTLTGLQALVATGQRTVFRWTSADPGVGYPAGHIYDIDGRGLLGDWVDLAAQAGAGGSYERILDVSVLPEGIREVRVSATDKAGRSRTETVPVQVDKTPPTFRGEGPEGGPDVSYPTPTTGRICFTADDGEGTGVTGNVEIERRIDLTLVGFRTLAAQEKVRVCTDVNLTGMAKGRNDFRLSVSDLAGNLAMTNVAVHVDEVPPDITGLTIAPKPGNAQGVATFEVSDAAGSGLAPGGTFLQIAPADAGGARTGEWETLWSGVLPAPAGGAQEVTVDLAGRDGKVWTTRVKSYDWQSNEAVSEPFTLDLRAPQAAAPPPAGAGPQPGPGTKLIIDEKVIERGANGQAEHGSDGRLRFRVVYPNAKPITLSGVLRTRKGEALPGQGLELWEGVGTRVERKRVTFDTAADGRWSVTVTPTVSGELRVLLPKSERVGEIAQGWDVEVVPFFRVTGTKTTKVGKPYLITGTFLPAPAAIAGGKFTVPKPNRSKPGKPKPSRGKPRRGKEHRDLARARRAAPRTPARAGSATTYAVEIRYLNHRAAKACRRYYRLSVNGRVIARAKGTTATAPKRCWDSLSGGRIAADGELTARVRTLFPLRKTAGRYAYGATFRIVVPATASWPFAEMTSKPIDVTVQGVGR